MGEELAWCCLCETLLPEAEAYTVSVTPPDASCPCESITLLAHQECVDTLAGFTPARCHERRPVNAIHYSS